MGRFASRWSDAHRAAVAQAVIDQGLTIEETRRQGKAGQLANLEPFVMPTSTVRVYIAKERARRDRAAANAATTQDIPRTADELLHRALTLCDRQLSKLETAPKPDLIALDRLAKTVSSIRREAAKTRTETAPHTQPDGPRSPASTPTDGAASMLDAMKQQQTGAEPVSVPPDDGDTDSDSDSTHGPIHYSAHADAQASSVREQLEAGV